MRLPERYIDAKEIIVSVLKKGKPIIKTKFNDFLVNPCELIDFKIEEKQENEIGSIKLEINYLQMEINQYEEFDTKKVTQNISLLTPSNDIIYPYNLVVKLWKGKYPSCVGIDFENKKVFLIYLEKSFKLVEFGSLDDNQLEALEEDLFEAKPYKIKLDEKAMFNFISEEEGYNHLRENIFIEFDCGVKIKVYKGLLEEN